MAVRHHHRFKREKTLSNFGLTIGGIRPVSEVLANPNTVKNIEEILHTPDLNRRHDLQSLFEKIGKLKIARKTTSSDDIAELTGIPNHQGLACRLKELPSLDFKELLNAPERKNLIALDQVQDPHNLGAVIRSANSFGLGAVLCPRDHSCKITQTVVKSSAGAIVHTPVVFVPNLARALEQLKAANYWVIALDGEAKQSIDTLDPGKPWVLVGGNEGSGIRQLVGRSADYHVKIPMLGEVGSLNVSVACAVAMYQLTR